MFHIYIYISYIYVYIYTHTRKIYVSAIFSRVFIYLNDPWVSDCRFECTFGPQLQASRRVCDIYDKPRVPFKASLVMFNL